LMERLWKGSGDKRFESFDPVGLDGDDTDLNGIKERRMVKGFGNLLKQAQEMHAKIAQLQEEMAGKTVEASSGGGMVNIVMNGKQEVVSLRIDPEVANREDVEMLQDLIIAALNEAIRKSQEMMTEEMKKVTGGLNIPGLF
jgi:DNA-binding YbaB/EbfC family protein